MRVVNSLATRFGIAGELILFFWHTSSGGSRRMRLMLLLLGALVIFAQGSAIAPFIYTLF